MSELNREKFIYWVTERESIRLLKESGLPPPWSADPVFQTVYFCNINREDDRVTRWIRSHYDISIGAALPNMILARMVNKPESLDKLGWPWADFREDLWYHVMSKPGSWGSAYVVSTNGHPVPKHEYVAGLLEWAFERFLHGPGATPTGTCAAWHTAIQAAPGLASFMAAQVVADLKNTAGHPLANAEDWHTFAAPGPGSLRGLTWFWGEKVTPSKFTDALVSARQWVHNRDSGLLAHLCNQNLQNCFCEYDKYMRVSMGTGRSKRKYAGR